MEGAVLSGKLTAQAIAKTESPVSSVEKSEKKAVSVAK